MMNLDFAAKLYIYSNKVQFFEKILRIIFLWLDNQLVVGD